MALPPQPGPGSMRDSTNPIRVFVLNDNKIFVESLKHFLGDEPGIRIVGSAAGLPEALAAAEHARPEIVVIDPEPHDQMIGQAIRELRSALPGAGIIVLTLHHDEPTRTAAMAAGADAFIGKWSASEELIDAIRAGAERGSRPGL